MIYTIGIENDNFESFPVDGLISYLESIEIVCLDTETRGFFNHSNKVICAQLGNKNIQFVIDENTLISLSTNDRFITICNTKTFIGHNLKFDYKFMKMYGIDIKHMYDTQLAEMILTTGYEQEERNLSLAGVAKKYLNVDLDKSIRGNIHREGFTDRVVKYSADDITYLEDIRSAQLKLIEEHDLLNVLWLENTSLRVFSLMEYYGIKVDSNNWKNTSKIIKEETIKIEENLDNVIVEQSINNSLLKKYINNQTTLFDIDYRKTFINWSSPLQKLNILKELGISLEDTSSQTLVKNSIKHPIIPKLIEYNKHSKLVSSFGFEFLKFINPVTGRVHAEIWQILNSGRISMKDPNLLQIPAHGELASAIKQSFIAEEGYTLIDSDFSGMELRVIAELSKDPLWMETFNSGGDLHSILCCKTFGIELEDVKNPFPYKPEVNYRFVQKTVNFGFNII